MRRCNMKNIMSTLESLQPVLVVDDSQQVSEAVLAALEVSILESDLETDIALVSVTDSFREIASFDQCISDLEAICNTIDTYGISKPIMEAADPEKGFVAAGIVVDYEELDDIPIKDDISQATVEGLIDVIKDAFASSAAALGKLFKKIGTVFAKFFKTVNGNIAIIESQVSKLKKASDINEEKFEGLKTKLPLPKDLKEIGSALDKLYTFLTDKKAQKIIDDTEAGIFKGKYDFTKPLSVFINLISGVLSDPKINDTLGLQVTANDWGGLDVEHLKPKKQ